MAGYRLDKALAELFPTYSRARLQQWLSEGQVLIDMMPRRRGKEKVQGGEKVQLTAQLEEQVSWPARIGRSGSAVEPG